MSERRTIVIGSPHLQCQWSIGQRAPSCDWTFAPGLRRIAPSQARQSRNSVRCRAACTLPQVVIELNGELSLNQLNCRRRT
jgi:hypothetical protein